MHLSLTGTNTAFLVAENTVKQWQTTVVSLRKKFTVNIENSPYCCHQPMRKPQNLPMKKKIEIK